MAARKRKPAELATPSLWLVDGNDDSVPAPSPAHALQQTLAQQLSLPAREEKLWPRPLRAMLPIALSAGLWAMLISLWPR